MTSNVPAVPDSLQGFDLGAAMKYDSAQRQKTAADLAKQEAGELFPRAGELGTEIQDLVAGDTPHQEKVRRIMSAREIVTGKTAATLVGITDQDALTQLLGSNDLSNGIKRALERLINPDDPEHIEVDENDDNVGTPMELVDARAKINDLESENSDWKKWADGPLHEVLEDFAKLLDLDLVDDETAWNMAKRIEDARADGAQPIDPNQQNPQPPTPINPPPAPPGGNQPPAPAQSFMGKLGSKMKGK